MLLLKCCAVIFAICKSLILGAELSTILLQKVHNTKRRGLGLWDRVSDA
jgi:hypothetical protein